MKRRLRNLPGLRRFHGAVGQYGFTLVEVIVAGFVLVVGLILMSQFFASAAGRVLESDIRSVMHQVAAQDIESIRSLPYDDVGTNAGHPQGVLQEAEDRTVPDMQNGNVRVHITREVVYWTDQSYSGPYPANYRRVTVSVSAVDRPNLGAVEMNTNVAGGVSGGNLDVTVVDSAGAPVADAYLTVTNDHLVPHVNIHSAAIRTDSTGHLLIPGLTPDTTTSYFVKATKSGYNDDTSEGLVVVDGLPYTQQTLIIDRVSTLTVRVLDTLGAPVPSLQVFLTGPKGYQQSIVSTDDGVTLTNLRFAAGAGDSDYYVARLVPGQGYDPVDTGNLTLAPGTAGEAILVVPAGGATTTTTAPPVTTTSTTAPQAQGSLMVRVLRSGTGTPVQNARVQLEGGRSLYTDSNGRAFFDQVVNGNYTIQVTRNNYHNYQGSVTVNGSTSVQISIVRQ